MLGSLVDIIQKTQSNVNHICMVCLVDMSATPQKLYGQLRYFQILSTFLYDIWVSHWLVNTI